MTTEWMVLFVVLGVAIGVLAVKQLMYFTNHPTYRQRNLKCLVRYRTPDQRNAHGSPAATSTEKL
jgi:predicted small secreted protein